MLNNVMHKIMMRLHDIVSSDEGTRSGGQSSVYLQANLCPPPVSSSTPLVEPAESHSPFPNQLWSVS